MNTRKNSMMAACLTAILAFSPVASFSQATITFSGEAVALKANALGISLALSDTGPLPASGGELSTSLSKVHVPGLGSADAPENTSSCRGTRRPLPSSGAQPKQIGRLLCAQGPQTECQAT